MIHYEIKKGVPIPPEETNCNTYPFAYMEVGDSFFFDQEKMKNVSCARSTYVKRDGYKKKFRIKRFDVNTYGCWRIE